MLQLRRQAQHNSFIFVVALADHFWRALLKHINATFSSAQVLVRGQQVDLMTFGDQEHSWCRCCRDMHACMLMKYKAFEHAQRSRRADCLSPHFAPW